MKVLIFALLTLTIAYAQNVDVNQHTYEINQLMDSKQQIIDDHKRTCEMLIKSCLNRDGVSELQAEAAENEREVLYVENEFETDKTFEEIEKAPKRGRKK